MTSEETMNYQNILFEIKDKVALLTLNRPQKLNSFTVEMHRELRDAMAIVKATDAIKILLLTGSGRGFCAGQDLNDRMAMPEQEGVDLGASVEKNYNPLIRSIMKLDKPVVCAVNGVAAGAGASLALACDIVVAAQSAYFVQAFSKIGLAPDSGATWNLPRALTLPRAKALTMLGDKLPAQQAAEWGMIWLCVDDDALMDEAWSIASRLSEQPSLALAAIKTMMNDLTVAALEPHLEAEKETMRRLGASYDFREGVKAFIEKRTPQFKGR